MKRSFRICRSAFTLVEVLLFGLLALALLALTAGVFSGICRQDSWNAARMEAVATTATVAAHLQEDLWLSRDVRVDGAHAIRLGIGGGASRPEEVAYRWSGPGAGLRRAGRRLGTHVVARFAVHEDRGVAASVELVLDAQPGPHRPAHAVRVTLPTRAPDAGRRKEFSYFAATDRDADGPPAPALP